MGGPQGVLTYSKPLILTDEVFQGAGHRTILDFSHVSTLVDDAVVVLRGGAQLRDCTIIGPGGNHGVVRVVDGEGALLSGLVVRGGRHSCIAVRGGSGVTVERCRVHQPDGWAGYGYGLALEGTEDATVIGGRYHARRHGIAVGNDPRTGVFSSSCLITGWAHISSEEIYAADLHQDTRACTYERCRIDGGMVIGGEGHTVSHCHVSAARTGECILVDAASKLDTDIIGNRLTGAAGTRALIFFDQNEFAPTGGQLRIEGNRAAATAGCPMYLRTRYAGLSAVLEGNILSSGDSTPMRVRGWGSSQWDRIDRSRNFYDVAPSVSGAVIDNPSGEQITRRSA